MKIKTFPSLILLFVSLLFLQACKTEPVDPDEEDLPRLAISGFSLAEGDVNNQVRLKVLMSKEWAEEVRFDYETQEVSAGENIDYVPASGTSIISPGQTEVFLEVDIIADTLKEGDEEFKVIISNPVNATIFTEEATVLIRNDDDFVFIPEGGYETPLSYPGHDLVWQDEFDGNSLNLSDWTHELGASGWGNEEWQFYTDREENSYVSDGRLIIEAKEESFSGSNYTSARIITRDQQSFMFGRIDIRAKLPEGQGIWPALWMLGDNFGTVGWPACGEIDIMELVGHEPNIVHGTVHWGPQGQSFSNSKSGSYTLPTGKFIDQFHVFSIVWEADQIVWMVDDNPYHTLTRNDVNGNYPFNNSFFFIFNVAVGGRWPGYPDASTRFPQQMVVDYVRVFQKN